MNDSANIFQNRRDCLYRRSWSEYNKELFPPSRPRTLGPGTAAWTCFPSISRDRRDRRPTRGQPQAKETPEARDQSGGGEHPSSSGFPSCPFSFSKAFKECMPPHVPTIYMCLSKSMPVHQHCFDWADAPTSSSEKELFVGCRELREMRRQRVEHSSSDPPSPEQFLNVLHPWIEQFFMTQTLHLTGIYA